MATQIQCPHCGQTYDLTPEQVPQYAGQTITCTKCQKTFTVPTNLAGAGSLPGFGPVPQQTYPTSYHYTPPKTNGMAIASLIFGLLGFFCPLVCGVVGLILGIVGLQKTKDPQVGGKGLAIAGISISAISLIFGIIIGIMIAAAIPSMRRSIAQARDTANRLKCSANMSGISQAISHYRNQNKGQYPPDLPTLLKTQDISSDIFVCPSTTNTPAPGATPQAQAKNLLSGGHESYRYFGDKLNNAAATKGDVVLYEPLSNHNNQGANVLFSDGSVKWMTKQEVQPLINRAEGAR